VIPHLYHIVPGGRYFRQAGQHFNPYTYDDIKTIADHAHYAGDIRANAHWGARREGGIVADDTNQAGGGHAHCGLAIYQSDQFPASYRNQLLFGNLHGHRLVNNYLDPKGSTYIGRHGSDFLRSNDMYFIPVTQKVGPDGSLYVSDWSDKQVCHRGSNAIEMWDRSNGRIYRVSYGPSDAGTPARKEGHDRSPSVHPRTASGETPDAARETRALQFPQAPFDLHHESDESLVRLAVQAENEWFSRMAKRLVMERTTVDTSRFASIARILERTPSTQEASALRHFWLALSAGGTTPVATPKPNEGLDHVRAWQVRAKAAESVGTGWSELANQDASPIVRRELASALQRFPLHQRSDIAAALLQHGEDKDDPYIPLLIWYGIEPVVGADAEAGLKLAAASKMPKVTEFIYRRLGTEEKGRVALLTMAAESADKTQQESLLRTVVEAARAGDKITLPMNWQELKSKLGQEALVQELEAFMGVEKALELYRLTVMNAASTAQREAALRILLQVRDPQTAVLLHRVIELNDAPFLRRSIQALATLPHEGTSALLLEKFASFDANLQTDVINTLATTSAGARGLLLAVKEGKVARSQLSPFLARQMDTLKDEAVKSLLKEVWGDLNAPKPDLEQRKVKFRTTLSKEALARADAKQGKLIFSATCGTCHRLLGEGQDVGPDLTGSNRGDLDYLLDNVLDPNAVIGKDYQLNIFELQDGRIASGVIKEETAAAYRVAMPGGIEQMVTKAEIKKRTVSPVSTMPEGLFDALPAESLLHLVKYLQSQTSASKGTSIKGAQEGEKLKTEASIGKAKVQPMGNFKEGHWSGDQHLWWTGGKVGNTLKIRFTKTHPGKQKLHAVFTKAPDYGIVSFQVAGQACALGDLDLYDPQVVNTPELQLGEFDLPPGECELVVTIQGHNAAAKPALMFALDYLRWE